MLTAALILLPNAPVFFYSFNPVTYEIKLDGQNLPQQYKITEGLMYLCVFNNKTIEMSSISIYLLAA